MRGQDLFFVFPQALFLLFLIPVFLLLFISVYFYREKIKDLFFKNEELIFQKTSKTHFFLNAFLKILAWIGVVFALTDPYVNPYYPPKLKQESINQVQHELLFLVDVSASMSVQDTLGGKSRLQFAQEIIEEVIFLLKTESIGLSVFTSFITPIVPLTYDYLEIRQSLKNLTINEGGGSGTDFFSVIEDLKETFFNRPNQTLKSVILFSDGEDPEIEFLSENDRKAQLKKLFSEVAKITSKNSKIDSVGIGSEVPSKVPNITFKGAFVMSALDPEILKGVAEKGSGKYFFSQNSPQLIAKSLFEEIIKSEKSFLATQKPNLNELLIYTRYYQIPLVIAILCLLLTYLIPRFFKQAALVLTFFFMVAEISAEESIGNDVRQAENFLQIKDFIKAKDIYNQLLEKPLSDWQRAGILYNLANVLAKGKDFDSAISLYQNISFENSLGPFLKYLSLRNLSIVQVEKSFNVLDLDEKEQLLKEALKNEEKSNEVKCAFISKLGNPICDFDRNFLNSIKVLLAENSINQNKMKVTDLYKRIELLLKGVEVKIQCVQIMQKNEVLEPLKQQYRLLCNNQKRLQELWNGEISLSPEKEALYNKAKQAYEQGIKKNNDDQYREAESFFILSSQNLKDLKNLFSSKKENKSLTDIKVFPSQIEDSDAQKAIQNLIEMENRDQIQKKIMPKKKEVFYPW